MNIAVLEHHLGLNIDFATSNSKYEPEVITEDGYDEDELKEAINSVEIQ